MKVAAFRRIVAMLGGAVVGADLLAGAAPALAGSAITPTLVELNSARQTGEVTLYNGGDTPMLVEASVVKWDQHDGRDVFEPTQDFIIAPALVEIRPGSGQIFRVRARVAPQGSEITYRLKLEDITPAQTETGIGMRVRHDLPLIVTAPGGRPDLHSGPCSDAASGCVRVSNRGTSRAKIMGLAVSSSGGETTLDGVTTILAGSWREWSLGDATIRGPLQVKALTDRGSVTAPYGNHD